MTQCDFTMTRKIDGSMPFRCSLPVWHTSEHRLVQEWTGKTANYPNPCCGGRIAFLVQYQV